MRNFAKILASASFKFILYAAAILGSLATIVATPTTIKESLASTKLYDSLVENIFDSAQKNLGSEAGNQVYVQNILKKAALDAFSPDFIRNSTEQFIDSAYRWLGGEVDIPDFRIDLSPAKDRFIANVANAAETYVAGLPICTLRQMRELNPQTDPFSLSCRPPTLSPTQAREQVITELQNNNDFIKTPVITASSLPKNQEGQTFFEQSPNIPKYYRLAKASIWLLPVIAVLLAIAVVLLNKPRILGVKSLGKSLAAVGLLIAVTTLILGYLLGKATQPNGAVGKSANSELAASLVEVLNTLAALFDKSLYVYSAVYLAIGGALLLGVHIKNKQSVTPAPASNTNKPIKKKTP